MNDRAAQIVTTRNSMLYSSEREQRRKPTTSHMLQQPIVGELNSNFHSSKKDSNPSFLIANSAAHDFNRELPVQHQNLLKPV
jgi:hypothetical protein